MDPCNTVSACMGPEGGPGVPVQHPIPEGCSHGSSSCPGDWITVLARILPWFHGLCPLHGSSLTLSAALLTLLVTGCSPGQLVAHQFLKAPRRFPTLIHPEPRVYFSFPDAVIDTIPIQHATMGDPPVDLAYRLIPPGDYGAEMIVSNLVVRGQSRPIYRYPGHPSTRTLPCRGTVVLLHGYGLDHETLIPWALHLAERGWLCVPIDLRGHGLSGGDRLTFGIREARDLMGLLDELERRGQVEPPIQVLGVSYGAAIALRWSGLDPRIRSVVAITPYDRLETAVEGLRESYAAWVPRHLTLKAVEAMPRLLDQPPGGLDPIGWVRERPRPALLVGADADPVAPRSSIEALKSAAPGSSAVFIPETSHEMAPFRLDLLVDPVAQWLSGASPWTPNTR